MRVNLGPTPFTITVTAGSDALTGVSVADPLTPDCARALTDLAPGASTSYTCVTGALTADLTNTATVNATAGTTAVSANDSALVVVDQPVLTITKTPSAQLVATGAVASFTITVSNPGTATFSNVTVSDPLTPSCASRSARLPRAAVVRIRVKRARCRPTSPTSPR